MAPPITLRKRRVTGAALALITACSVLAVGVPPGPAPRAAAQTASVTLKMPDTMHANGAELRWTRYSGPLADFSGYEVHRSRDASFTPSSSTLVARLSDIDTTSLRDTTAAPDTYFTYKIVAGGAATAGRTVRLPVAGHASKSLTAEPGTAAATYVAKPATGYDCKNYGASGELRVGTTDTATYRGLVRFDLRDVPASATVTSATLSLHHGASTIPSTTIDVHRLRRPWNEGSGGCGDNASWYQSQSGAAWTGGDFDGVAAASLAVDGAAGWDDFTGADLVDLVQGWVTGRHTADGVLLKLRSEALAAGNYLTYSSDDGPDATLRPTLRISYVDGSAAQSPWVALATPATGARVSGRAVPLKAAASDDGRVTKVEFLVDGAAVGVDGAPPYELTWDSTTVASGTHDVTARAYDDAGNTTSSAATTISVDNTARATVTLSSPTTGASVAGDVTVTATATPPSGESITRVEFYVDDVLFSTDTTAPYAATWRTLDPLDATYDGSHVLMAKVYESAGHITASEPRTVTVANVAGTKYAAAFDVDEPGTVTDATSIPQSVVEDLDAPSVDPASEDPSLRTLSSGPINTTRGLETPPTTSPSLVDHKCDPAAALCPDVTVTNTSDVTWHGDDLQLWYRWFTADGVVLLEGPGNEKFPTTVHPGQSKTVPMDVFAPRLPPGAELGRYSLRFDIYDVAAGKWFGGSGNAPVTNPVVVNKALDSALGLERYYHYEGEDVGAGMSHLTNVANGNSLLRLSPMYAPGRGLATMVDITYNSLEDHSESPIGNNFSLSMSGLTRFGNPIDVHPNKADDIAGRSNRYVVFTDGDGTSHRFVGKLADDGTVYWEEPPGVHLYLREYSATDPARKWAFTRPDRVTYFFDGDGFPTFIRDRNGNELTYVLEETPPAADPGGPKKRIVAVRDAGGRSFGVDYYSRTETRSPHVRGQIQRITDHTGSALDFNYYDDGNLREIVQRGGTNADGSFLADRRWTFTYTKSNGEGAATTNPFTPSSSTPNQSTLVHSVADPRRKVTRFDYYGPSEGSQVRSKLQTRTNRTNDVTGYSYDIVNRVTTKTAPLQRVTRYSYDTTAKVTSIVDPANRTTRLTWSSDFHVQLVTEPKKPSELQDRVTRYTYTSNGYVASITNPKGERTRFLYQNVSAGAGDPAGDRDKSPYWKAGRGMPHVSQLYALERPLGDDSHAGNPVDVDDHQWNFRYDTRGNLLRLIEPEPAERLVDTRYTTRLSWNADGTLASIYDANDDPVHDKPTRFLDYDANGLPTRIVDAEDNTTLLSYNADGLLTSIRDPRHSPAGPDDRTNRIELHYDSFHRLGRQSAPKSTAREPGLLIWSAAEYDANDNVVKTFDPSFGYGGPGAAPKSTTEFDAMDRPVAATNQDNETTTYDYDDGGRLVKVTSPMGRGTPSVANDRAVLYEHDVLDRVVKESRYAFDSNGTLVAERHTHLCYDVPGDLVSITAPKAAIIGRAPCPQPAEADYVWRFEYDEVHRLVKTIDPEGRARLTKYDANGNVASTTNENGETTTYEYDDRDLRVKVTEPFDADRQIVTKLALDGVGNVVQRISPRAWDAANGGAFSQYVTNYRYDGTNRLTRIALPTSDRHPEAAYVHRSYDANGNLAWVSLPTTAAEPENVSSSAMTAMTHFDPGWLRTSDDGVNPKVHFDYSAVGQQTERTPEKRGSPGTLDLDAQMRWSYHPDGMLAERKDRGGRPTTYAYDANNNLSRALDAGGVAGGSETPLETEADYNAFDEPSEIRHRRRSTTSTPNPWTFTRYDYDANGNVAVRLDDGKRNDSGAQTEAPRRNEYTYDRSDWLVRQHDRGTDSACKNDRWIVTDYLPTGWEKQRDVHRMPDGCTAEDTGWEHKQRTTWLYFGNGKLRELQTRNGRGELLESHVVGYHDANGDYVNGHRTEDQYVLKGATSTVCTSSTSPCIAKYVYDARDRLIEHRNGHGGTTTYGLDQPQHLVGNPTIRAGNVTTETAGGVTTTRQYKGNQLVSATAGGDTAKYWYDDLGNLDCVTNAAGTQGDCSPAYFSRVGPSVVADYSYDYLGRLSTYRAFASGDRIRYGSYEYDALDRLVSEFEQHDEWSQGATRFTRFSYQGLTNLVTKETHRDASGVITNTKTYSYDAWGHRIGMDVTKNGSTDRYTYGYDVHGSVSLLVGDAGEAKATYGYTPYGGEDTTLTTGDPIDRNADPINPYRYTADRYDTASGTVDMGARRFGPDTTRFLQQDVLYGALADLGLSSDPLTQNRYALAGGNPVSFVELDGHMPAYDLMGTATSDPSSPRGNAGRPASGGTGSSGTGSSGTGSSGSGHAAARHAGDQRKAGAGDYGVKPPTMFDFVGWSMDVTEWLFGMYNDELGDFVEGGLESLGKRVERLDPGAGERVSTQGDRVERVIEKHGRTISKLVDGAGIGWDIFDTSRSLAADIRQGSRVPEAVGRTGSELGAEVAAARTMMRWCPRVPHGAGKVACSVAGLGLEHLAGEGGSNFGELALGGGDASPRERMTCGAGGCSPLWRELFE